MMLMSLRSRRANPVLDISLAYCQLNAIINRLIEQELNERRNQKRKCFEIVAVESANHVRRAPIASTTSQQCQQAHRGKKARLDECYLVVVKIAAITCLNEMNIEYYNQTAAPSA